MITCLHMFLPSALKLTMAEGRNGHCEYTPRACNILLKSGTWFYVVLQVGLGYLHAGWASHESTHCTHMTIFNSLFFQCDDAI